MPRPNATALGCAGLRRPTESNLDAAGIRTDCAGLSLPLSMVRANPARAVCIQSNVGLVIVPNDFDPWHCVFNMPIFAKTSPETPASFPQRQAC